MKLIKLVYLFVADAMLYSNAVILDIATSSDVVLLG